MELHETNDAEKTNDAETDWLVMSAVAKRYGLHPNTPARWAVSGVVRNGRRVKLRVRRIGGQRKTTEAWLEEFMQATRDQDGDGSGAVVEKDPSDDSPEAEVISHSLDAAGI